MDAVMRVQNAHDEDALTVAWRPGVTLDALVDRWMELREQTRLAQNENELALAVFLSRVWSSYGMPMPVSHFVDGAVVLVTHYHERHDVPLQKRRRRWEGRGVTIDHGCAQTFVGVGGVCYAYRNLRDALADLPRLTGDQGVTVVMPTVTELPALAMAA